MCIVMVVDIIQMVESLQSSIYNRQNSINIQSSIFNLQFFSDGGERGIRTLGAAFGSTHDFQSCSFNQLGHLSGYESEKKPECLTKTSRNQK